MYRVYYQIRSTGGKMIEHDLISMCNSEYLSFMNPSIKIQATSELFCRSHFFSKYRSFFNKT